MTKASKENIKMNQHRENLLKLIKMMRRVEKDCFIKYTEHCSPKLSKEEAVRYIDTETLISIRELTRMFIEELNSEYLQCEENDEIVIFIRDMIEWIQSAYDYIIEGNKYSGGVKELKICSQSLNDYKRAYEKANIIIRSKYGEVAKIEKNYFEFGKKATMYFTKDGVNVVNGKVCIHDDPPVISPEYTKKIDEVYEWVQKQKENQLTEDKIIKIFENVVNKESKRFRK
jgi:hypothetical protein